MSAFRAASLLAALALAVPSPAAHAASHPAPVAECQFADVYTEAPYFGFAYVTGTDLPVQMTLACFVTNGWDRFDSTQTVAGPAVALAFSGHESHADSLNICTTADAKYADGTVVTTSHCGAWLDPEMATVQSTEDMVLDLIFGS